MPRSPDSSQRPGDHSFAVAACTAALSILAAVSPADASGYLVEDVRLTESMQRSSLAFDAAGNPAIAYGEDVLRFAAWDGADFTFEVVDRDLCNRADGLDAFPSLLFDLSGDPAIAYTSGRDGALKFARRSGGIWRIETIEAVGAGMCCVGHDASLALDSAGLPAIGYVASRNGATNLHLARFDGSAWSIEEVYANGGRNSSLAFGPNGQPALAFSDDPFAGGHLLVARFDGSAWSIEPVDTPAWPAEGTSIAFDGSGNPAVGYIDGVTSTLRVARRGTSAWTIEVVEPILDGGSTPSLRLGPNGALALAWRDGGVQRFAQRNPGGWASETIETHTRVLYPSLAFDSAGEPAVSFTSQEDPVIQMDRTLRLARHAGGSWSSSPIVAMAGYKGSDIRFDGSGRPVILHESARGGVWLARAIAGRWQSEVVDGGFNFQVALAIDALGQPAASYVDATTRQLKVARFDGTNWSSETAAFNVWLDRTSIAFDAAGFPAVGYTDSLGNVLFARRDPTAWSSTVVATTGTPLGLANPSLRFDPAGNPAIAYQDFGSLSLKLARDLGTGWSSEVVDSGSVPCGGGPSLAFDPGTGQPAIAYHCRTDLKFARFDGSVWLREVVAPTGPSPEDAAMAFDANGQPVIAFGDQTIFRSEPLRLARRDASTWSFEIIDVMARRHRGVGLAFDPSGAAWTTWSSGCGDELATIRVASPLVAGTLRRAPVVTLGAGWKVAALPLTGANDDRTAPFPIATALPGTVADALPPTAPLVLYRLLGPGDIDAGNRLKLVRGASAVLLDF